MDIDTPRDLSPKAAPMAPMEREDATMTDLSAQSSDIYNPPSPGQEPTQQDHAEVLQPPSSTTPAQRSRLPDSRVHTDWKPSAVAMAKCDICDKRGRGTVYMCQSCSQSVCYSCCEGGRLGAGHVLDHTSVSWDLHLATKQEKPKKRRAAPRASAARGRGGRARGGAAKRRASRDGSTVSVDARETTQELDELNRSSNSSGLSDPPTSLGSSPTQLSPQHTQEPQEVPPPVSHPPRKLAMRPEPAQLLPRITDRGPQQSHDDPSHHASASRTQYLSSYTQLDQQYNSYNRQPSQTSYTSQERAPERYIPPPMEDYRPAFREPALRDGPPTSYETYSQPSHLATYAREAYARLPSHPSTTISACPYFTELRSDLLNAIQGLREEMRDSSLETHLYTAISRAWNRGKLCHLRHISEQAAFKMLVAISNAAFVQLNAPRNHAARQWLKDLEDQLVEAGAIKPLKDMLFS